MTPSATFTRGNNYGWDLASRFGQMNRAEQLAMVKRLEGLFARSFANEFLAGLHFGVTQKAELLAEAGIKSQARVLARVIERF